MTDKEKQDYMQVQARLSAKHLIESKNRRKENSQKQIEEMAKVLHDRIVDKTWRAEKVAEEIYKIAVPEGSVVLSEKEKTDLYVEAWNKGFAHGRKETASEETTSSIKDLIQDRLNISIREFAKEIDISRHTIMNILLDRHKPTALTTKKICSYFGEDPKNYI